jgi:hypothetical protein
LGLRTFIRFKNPAQAPRYSSVVDIFPSSFSAAERFTNGVEPSDDHNEQPEIEKNCIHPRIVSLKKNRGHEPNPKDDGHYPQTTFSAIRHALLCIVALQYYCIARFQPLFMPSGHRCWREIRITLTDLQKGEQKVQGCDIAWFRHLCWELRDFRWGLDYLM